MKSATGNLIIWMGLLIVHLSGIAARALQCKPVNLVSLVEHGIHQIIHHYDLHQSHVKPKPKEMQELLIDARLPEEQQEDSALCGLTFMEEALRQVFNHRDRLNVHADLLKDVVRKVEKNLKPCVELTFQGRCEEPHLKPKFPVKNYEAKQWSRSILDLSKEFLKQLRVLLRKTTDEPNSLF